MTGQVVTAADLEFPWRCESCHRDFQVGDIAYGQLTGMVEDDPMVEYWHCLDCQEAVV